MGKKQKTKRERKKNFFFSLSLSLSLSLFSALSLFRTRPLSVAVVEGRSIPSDLRYAFARKELENARKIAEGGGR